MSRCARRRGVAPSKMVTSACTTFNVTSVLQLRRVLKRNS